MGSSFGSSRSVFEKLFRMLIVLMSVIMGGTDGALAAILQQTSPTPVTYTEGTHYSVMSFSATGDVTAGVFGVDIQLGLGNTSTSGCEVADFAGFVAGSIALIQRGICSFEQKAENASAAGAAGVLIFNQGNAPTSDRMDLFFGTLGSDYTGGIPVMGLTYALGEELSQTPGLVMHMQVIQDDLAVPEPGSLALLGIAAIILVATRHRMTASDDCRRI